MSVKLLTEHRLEFLSFKGDCIGSFESTLVKMPHCWKSHVPANFYKPNLHPKLAEHGWHTKNSMGYISLIYYLNTISKQMLDQTKYYIFCLACQTHREDLKAQQIQCTIFPPMML